ncbi:hypothetical protein L596_030185 [Steinernema carpocapsae]|uniref:Uncharacterized protein n=1 Tax=Steinernema carpocapsae TaxID=34508 RepID=A0A4U5LS04_STECR|nr:hypothetical protein L596_030185 [Steinernema carpocapsae]
MFSCETFFCFLLWTSHLSLDRDRRTLGKRSRVEHRADVLDDRRGTNYRKTQTRSRHTSTSPDHARR